VLGNHPNISGEDITHIFEDMDVEHTGETVTGVGSYGGRMVWVVGKLVGHLNF